MNFVMLKCAKYYHRILKKQFSIKAKIKYTFTILEKFITK